MGAVWALSRLGDTVRRVTHLTRPGTADRLEQRPRRRAVAHPRHGARVHIVERASLCGRALGRRTARLAALPVRSGRPGHRLGQGVGDGVRHDARRDDEPLSALGAPPEATHDAPLLHILGWSEAAPLAAPLAADIQALQLIADQGTAAPPSASGSLLYQMLQRALGSAPSVLP